ncbi:MAG: zf-HC2 domain-containing protein [Planctomycetes bacterium]|nr:zf-HC2 domain-containing protein [Planctomycetota bacterium]MBI3848245.1 zf-HC2 domain-containing protein [Planctomycetota bacterium]
MNCDETRLELVAFADGELSQLEAQSVREHLATCTACAALADGHRATGDLLSEYPGIEVRTKTTLAILDAVEREATSRPRRVVQLRRWLAAAAVVAALVTIGSLVWHPHIGGPSSAGVLDDPVVLDIVQNLDLYDKLDDLMAPDIGSDLDLRAADPDVDDTNDREG